MENEKKELNPDELEQANGGVHHANKIKHDARKIGEKIREGEDKTTRLDRIITKCTIWFGDLFFRDN